MDTKLPSLRPYQRRAIDRVRACLRGRVVLLAAGLGKSAARDAYERRKGGT